MLPSCPQSCHEAMPQKLVLSISMHLSSMCTTGKCLCCSHIRHNISFMFCISYATEDGEVLSSAKRCIRNLFLGLSNNLSRHLRICNGDNLIVSHLAICRTSNRKFHLVRLFDALMSCLFHLFACYGQRLLDAIQALFLDI